MTYYETKFNIEPAEDVPGLDLLAHVHRAILEANRDGKEPDTIVMSDKILQALMRESAFNKYMATESDAVTLFGLNVKIKLDDNEFMVGRLERRDI